MSVFSERLTQLMKQNDVSDNQLAEHFDVSRTTVSRWRSGERSPKMNMITPIAEYFNISPTEFVETNLLSNNQFTTVKNIVSIPVLGDIACGEPILAEENILGYRDRSSTNLPTGDVFYLKAKGNSMDPKIPDGSFVLIREQPDVENGEIAAVLVNGDTEATLKRVRKVQDSLILEPLNPDYNPYIVNENNPARILGKAIEVTSVL
ncbi:LexA family protein [Vagococcus sp.]|uniref:LexA family protein n=1 Tax=Vagococcus sp. TaxID=1933889 RepID=UPI003F96C3DE